MGSKSKKQQSLYSTCFHPENLLVGCSRKPASPNYTNHSSSSSKPAITHTQPKRESILSQKKKAHQDNHRSTPVMVKLNEKDETKIKETKLNLNLIDSFNILINLSQTVLLSFNSARHHHQGLKKTLIGNETSKAQKDQELKESFYHLALFRFELWIGRIADHLPPLPSNQSAPDKEDDYQIELTLDYLPPLDVLFVWYCYCLSSRCYYEDSLRLYPILKHLKFPLELAATEYDLIKTETAYQKLGETKTVSEEETEGLLKALRSSSVDLSELDSRLLEPSHWNNLNSFSGLLLPKSFHSRSGAHSKQLWLQLTNTDFDLITFINQPSFRTFLCPHCDGTIESPFYVADGKTDQVQVTRWCWPYHTSDPRSLAKLEGKIDSQTFADLAGHCNQAKLRCRDCHWVGIKQDLSLFKFLEAFKFVLSGLAVRKPQVDDHQDLIDCLAGTLTTEDSLEDVKNATKFNHLLLKYKNDRLFKKSTQLNREFLAIECLNFLRRLQAGINHTILGDKSVPNSEKLKLKKCYDNLLKAYSVPEPFSVDLIRSMKLETHFIRKMVSLGWTDILDTKNEDSTTASEGIDNRLQSCISRYNAFAELVLMINPRVILIPTLDIDLAWKTDRLKGVRYTQLMMRKNKKMIDHPNEIDFSRSGYLAHFRLTSALWILRYQIEYSRYPAPFVKVDRRLDWLKKAVREISRSSTTPSVECRDDKTGTARVVEGNQEMPQLEIESSIFQLSQRPETARNVPPALGNPSAMSTFHPKRPKTSPAQGRTRFAQKTENTLPETNPNRIENLCVNAVTKPTQRPKSELFKDITTELAAQTKHEDKECILNSTLSACWLEEEPKTSQMEVLAEDVVSLSEQRKFGHLSQDRQLAEEVMTGQREEEGPVNTGRNHERVILPKLGARKKSIKFVDELVSQEDWNLAIESRPHTPQIRPARSLNEYLSGPETPSTAESDPARRAFESLSAQTQTDSSTAHHDEQDAYIMYYDGQGSGNLQDLKDHASEAQIKSLPPPILIDSDLDKIKREERIEGETTWKHHPSQNNQTKFKAGQSEKRWHEDGAKDQLDAGDQEDTIASAADLKGLTPNSTSDAYYHSQPAKRSHHAAGLIEFEIPIGKIAFVEEGNRLRCL